jgi:hypothetical protein
MENLGFYVLGNDGRVYSRQYGNMYIDEDQGLGTLVRFDSKLILRREGIKSTRTVLVPKED